MKTGLTNCPERVAAVESGQKFYFIEKPCRNGHVSKRYTNGGMCWTCSSLRVKGVFHSGETSQAEAFHSIKTSVYVVEAGEYVKVGIAENVASRLQVLRTHCPIPARLFYCTIQMPRLNALKIETACHERLNQHHSHGEWFRVGADVVVSLVKEMEPLSGMVAEVDPKQDVLGI